MTHILFIAEDTSKLLNKNYHYLEQELAKEVNVTIWRKPGHISYILRQLNTRPDFILLLNDIDKQMSPMIKGLSNINIPTGIFVNDVHRFTSLRRNYIKKNNISYVFTIIRDKFIEKYPEFTHKMEWFPHFVNTELCRDYGLEKEINLLMMGAVNEYYPLRQKIVNYYSNNKDFVYHSHPGYQNFSEKDEQHAFIGENYAKEINRAKMLFTCPSTLKYPVIKYFETLACKTLLLAPSFTELEDLGFIPDYHFVPIDENNFQQKAAYFLENEKERQKIVEQGYHFIRQRHSVKIRVQQLIKKIEIIINQ
ncbi:glycosyltransferase [Aquibacillus rhizosphaerae]|uniref:Glycosyltransferase n=1 Tax=Aquibacillus rhizosphaerae TaxID=3051431 RepID=A0ABT7L1R4_9BACI|nr:glycosyltransferase [Aquibacillus sp. LR5S19]MDL4839759.1 glycosyltransferase [Aquibacillus sp. LR5S19]